MDFIKKHPKGYSVEIYLMGRYEFVGVFKTKKAAETALNTKLKKFL